MKNKLIVFIFLLFASQIFSQSRFESNPVPFTPADKRIEDFNAMLRAKENSLVKNIEFRSVGPTVMSGRVVDVDVNPEDPTIFYAAYASGGLWKTTNNGISFTPIFDNEAAISIGDIAVDWKNNIIYVGTGENNSSRSSYSGTGIYKSTDDGKSWQNSGLTETHRTGRIIIDPNNPNVILVAALGHLFSSNSERGIYKTTNGGKSWRNTLYIDDITGGIDIAYNPKDKRIVYAAMWSRERRIWEGYESGKNSGIYKSVDGGETWFLSTTRESGFPVSDFNGRIGLAVYPGNPDIIYALMDNQENKEKVKKSEAVTKDMLRKISVEDFLKLNEDDLNEFLEDNNFPDKYNADKVFGMVRNGKLKPVDLVYYLEDPELKVPEANYKGGEVYRTDDGGKTWKKTHEGNINDLFYTYGYYFANIRVSPVNPEKIYILGVPLIKSEDGGKTYRMISNENTHADHHAMWINPNREGHIILGNDGGINISYDDGKTWFKANTPAVGQFYTVNVDYEKPYNVYGGLQDNGAWYGPSTYTANYEWYSMGNYPYKNIMGGDGMQVAIDSRDNNTVYTGYQFGNYYRINKAKQDYTYITPKHELGEKPYRFNWQSPIQISAHNQDIIYLGSNRLHRSMNKGDRFENISEDLTNGGKPGKVPNGTLTAIHESPLKFGLIYTGSDDGAVFVTKSGGYEWESISEGLPKDYWISRIQASAFDTGTVYVSLNGFRWDNFDANVYRSTNFGKDWIKIGSGLPLSSVNVIKEDPNNKNIIYAGTDNGVFVSLNNGKDFMQFSKGLPNVPVHDLVIHPRDKELIIGTHGRSIYIADVRYLEELDEDMLSRALNVFDISELTHDKSWGFAEDTWSDTVIPEQVITFYCGKAGNISIDIYSEDTVKLNHFEYLCDRGLNFFKYDLSVGIENVESYIKDKTDYKKTQTGKEYLKPGKYTVKFALNGVSEEKTFEIKGQIIKRRK
ncbi:MAG: glycosyl hydrolase [Ignavibacteriae bacterium]|nr:glycosyl hydrolase [Ignavibacteriota bacterium]